MADRLVEQHARPAGAAHDRHLAGGRCHRLQIDQRLRERFVDRAFAGRGIEQAIVEIAAADAEEATLAPAILLDDDRDVEPHQRADVRGDEAVGPHNLDHAPRSRQPDRHLRDARILRTRERVDRLAQRNLLRERHEAERIGIAIEMPIRARRRRRLSGFGRIEQAHRLGGAADRGFRNLVGMSERGRLPRHAAQAEARLGVEVRRLEAAIVEAEALRRQILQVELAIVGPRQSLRRKPSCGVRVQQAIAIQEGAGVGEARHAGRYRRPRGAIKR